MNSDNSWRNKTLEALEPDYWPRPAYDSHLAMRCYSLRTVPLDRFTIEDLRMMISQEISLRYLIPLALELLAINLFAEGDFFEGDLLKSVLAIKSDYWNAHEGDWMAMANLIKDRRSEIAARKIDTINFDQCRHQ